MHITHGLQSLMACILPTIHCRSTNCWELLHLFAHHCDYRPNTSQHCWPIGADLGGGCRGCAPPPPRDDLRFSNTTGILQKKTMWFIGVEVEQETIAPPPKKILDLPLAYQCWQLLCLFACSFRKCYILAGCRQTYIVQVTPAPTPP